MKHRDSDILKTRNKLREQIAKNVKDARTRSDLTQVEVAQALGIHQSAYSRIERGRQCITADQLLTLATILNVRPEILIEPQPL